MINRLYLLGGEARTNYVVWASVNPEAIILEISEAERKWTKAGEMKEKRSYHAVSIVDYADFKNYCQ